MPSSRELADECFAKAIRLAPGDFKPVIGDLRKICGNTFLEMEKCQQQVRDVLAMHKEQQEAMAQAGAALKSNNATMTEMTESLEKQNKAILNLSARLTVARDFLQELASLPDHRRKDCNEIARAGLKASVAPEGT